MGEGIAVRRGGGAVQAGAHGVYRVKRAQQPWKLRRRVIDLLLHMPIPLHEHEVLRRDEDNARRPDLHINRILATLQLDLAAERAEGAGLAIDCV